jgi:hypothetical protein
MCLKQSGRQTDIEISIRITLSKLIQRHLTNYSLLLLFFPLCCQSWIDKLSEFYRPAAPLRVLALQILLTFIETISLYVRSIGCFKTRSACLTLTRIVCGTTNILGTRIRCRLGCCAVQSGRCLPTFQRCLQPPCITSRSRCVHKPI